MKELQHLTISASAGSGKTYQLTNRYIQLLAREIPPERIVALTFTRKAAGEIFDRIVQRLAEAATSQNVRNELSRELDHTLTEDAARKMLKDLITAMPLLRVGTLDSFMSQIVRLFAYELGIQGGFEIIDGPAKALETQRALKQVLSHTLNEKAKTDFLEHFKQATYGSEEKSVVTTLTQFIEENHRTYLNVPDGALWGNPTRIWPDGCQWFEHQTTREHFLNVLSKIAAKIEDFTPALQKPWNKLIKDLQTFDANALPGGRLVELLLENYNDLKAGPVTFKFGKANCTLDAEMAKHTFALMNFAISKILATRLTRTQGMYRILDRYEDSYSRLVRNAGKLAFSDILQILRGKSLTQDLLDSSDALYIDYRLDGRFDHWMIDEFQDTSDAQWSVLSNLINEIMVYEDGSRSFFYVGDVKQAIYGWRGGDSRLFDRILQYYGSNIQKQTLPTSYRSSPHIISAVNKAFSELPTSDKLPQEVIERWNSNWEPHRAAREQLPGYSAFYEIQKINKPPTRDADEIQRYTLAAGIAAELLQNPNLTIAMLVRSGKAGIKLTNLLRKNGIPATWEGDSEIIDNPITAALLALLKLAQHPGDLLAREHIQMTPLYRCIQEAQLNWTTLPLDLLHDIHHHGFRYTLEKWINHCVQCTQTPSTPYSKSRINHLLQCAGEFDLLADRNVVRFIHYATETKSRTAVSGQVRVLTIHKSKGLGFDAVILPDLQSSKGGIDSVGRIGLTTHSHYTPEGAEPEWTFIYPAKELVNHDPELSAHRKEIRSDKTYEELCALYVAMTRAKHGLYMITTAPAKDSESLNPSVLLKQQFEAGIQPAPPQINELDCTLIYECGTPDWTEKLTSTPDHEPQNEPTLNLSVEHRIPRLQRHIPSAEEHSDLQANLLFARHGRKAADFGTAIHSLFEELEWISGANIESLIAQWIDTSTLSADTKKKTVEEFRQALESDDVKKALTRPTPTARLWREKRFEIALGQRWISGCFDRVTIEYDANGLPSRATILDYKSNRIHTQEDISHARKTYRPQLALYREVLSAMLCIPQTAIATDLLFTHLGSVINIHKYD